MPFYIFDELGRKLGIRNFWKIVLKELDSDLDANIELDIKNRTDDPRDSCADYSKYAKSIMDHFRVNDTSIYASIHDKFISNVTYSPMSRRYTVAANCTMHHALFNVTICTSFRVTKKRSASYTEILCKIHNVDICPYDLDFRCLITQESIVFYITPFLTGKL